MPLILQREFSFKEDGEYVYYRADDEQLKVYGDIQYAEEGARVMTYEQIGYLELSAKDNVMSAGETVSFPLENAAHRGLGCLLVLDGGFFNYDIRSLYDGDPTIWVEP